MTKREARAKRTADWNIAISEGRVVRFETDGQIMHTSYPTRERAETAVRVGLDNGLSVSIVDPKLAEVK